MRLILLFALLLSILAPAGAPQAFADWNELRTSALLPGNTVTIRVENPYGPGLVNTILYAQGGVQEVPLTVVNDGPSTLEATVPGPTTGRLYYGFRLTQNGEIDLLPVRLADGATPQRTDITLLADDPVGDETTGRINLDLTACRITRDSTHLYAALTNAGGGFPVSEGLTFLSYLLGITDPAVSDPDTVFGMIQTVSVSGIIEPGLYQINGSGVSDLVKIGEITATELPGENTLILSCLLSDLEANSVFQSWYDPSDPRIGVAGFTQKITLLGGVVVADSTQGGVWHLREVALDPVANQLPQLSGLTLPPATPGGFATVVYSDANSHCPVTAELVIDGNNVYPLRPQTLEYGGPVEYRSDPDLPPLLGGGWSQAVARFSDNLNDIVELEQFAVGIPDGDQQFPVRVAPNPSFANTNFFFSLETPREVSLVIYDLSGRRVATLVDAALPMGPHSFTWSGRDDAGLPQPAGVYFYRLRRGNDEIVSRLVRLR